MAELGLPRLNQQQPSSLGMQEGNYFHLIPHDKWISHPAFFLLEIPLKALFQTIRIVESQTFALVVLLQSRRDTLGNYCSQALVFLDYLLQINTNIFIEYKYWKSLPAWSSPSMCPLGSSKMAWGRSGSPNPSSGCTSGWTEVGPDLTHP